MYCKISGLDVPHTTWTPDLQREVVLTTLDLFGPWRCMFASNFPVDALWATYAQIFGGFQDLTADLSASEQRAVFFDTACDFYRIGPDRLWSAAG